MKRHGMVPGVRAFGTCLSSHASGQPRLKVVAAALVLSVLLLLLVGCQTAMTPGSAYMQTGRYRELLAEPTFDIGYGTESQFYNFQIPHVNPDGHWWFDVPIVVVEQLAFSPVWVLSGLLRLTGSEPYLRAPFPTDWLSNPLGSAYVLAQKGLAWTLAVPGTACYMLSFATVMAFDTVFHDVPVIVVGAPFRIWRAIQ